MKTTRYLPVFLLMAIGLIFAGFTVYHYATAQMTDSDTLDITAVVAPPPTPTPSNLGGGFATGGATVDITGLTFPNAKLTLFKDGQRTTTLVANTDGAFRILINSLTLGNYQFSVFAEDEMGEVSAPYTINVSALRVQPYVFTNIILPPTIKASTLLAEIRKPFYVSGYAPVGATVNLELPGVSVLSSALADSRGFYRIEVIAGLAPGIHSLRTKANYNNNFSSYSKPVQLVFYVPGDLNSPPPPTQYATCVDYNHDNRVNLIDFSILLFWFGKQRVPETVDCNGDRIIDLKDFSILMYFWTS